MPRSAAAFPTARATPPPIPRRCCGCTPRSSTPRCGSTRASSVRSRRTRSANTMLEAAEVAKRLGVLPADLPPDVPELRGWMAGMIASGRVRVTPAARQVAATVLLSRPARPAGRVGCGAPGLARHAARSAAAPVRHLVVARPGARRRAPGGRHPPRAAAGSAAAALRARRRGQPNVGCALRSDSSASENERGLAVSWAAPARHRPSCSGLEGSSDVDPIRQARGRGCRRDLRPDRRWRPRARHRLGPRLPGLAALLRRLDAAGRSPRLDRALAIA